jgi:guanine deaminase
MNSDHASQHKKFLCEAVELSRTSMNENNGGPFGAIIVRDGVIIARGWNQVTAWHDPTAHAEVVAIRNACKELAQFSLAGCTLYTSCEPCPMCLAAIYWARLDQVIYANTRYQAADIGFDDAFIYDEIAKTDAERSIKINHMPLDMAQDVFAQWMQKADKIPY